MNEAILLTILLLLLGIVAFVIMIKWGKSKRLADAPDELIPSQDEMMRLRSKVLSGDQDSIDYWFRGAVYYESQRLYGKTAREALELALDPELAQIGFRVERVNG